MTSPIVATPQNIACRPARGNVVARIAKDLVETLVKMRALRRERHALSGLDAARLHDIGVTREQAQAEAERPFWDAPTYWR